MEQSTKHSADWKLGYCRAALEAIIRQIESAETGSFGPITYALELAITALEKTK
jgi:hypothetical protein